jgi:cytochrome c5
MAGSAGVTVTVGQSAAAPRDVQAPRSAWSGVYTEEQAERGATIFRKACGYCHRDNLRGDYGPPLVGVDFTYPWDGRTLGELYDTMSSTMPPASAVDRVVLQPKDYVDIIGFILRANGLPSGGTQLPTDAARLREIVFTRHSTP